jgi:co-chaperonin GroES (HSP10)
MHEENKVLIPALDRIVLKKHVPVEEPKAGGIIIPSSMPKQDRYEVWKMHPRQGAEGQYWIPPKEGDICYIDKYKGIEIESNGQKYLVVSIEDIIAYESGSNE